jgi:VanZ family protein
MVISLNYLGIIIILSLMPAEDVPQIALFEGVDKLVHLSMYLGFTWLLCWSLHSGNKTFINYIVIILTICWGILMEVFQLIMHFGRAFEWLDILANSIGAIIGVIIYNLMVTNQKKQ